MAFSVSCPVLQGSALVQVPSVPLPPILMQRPWSPKQASMAHMVRGARRVGLLFPVSALHPKTAARPQICRRLRRERVGTHQGLSNNLVERKRETGRQQGQKVLLNLYPSLMKQGKSNKMP